MAPGESAHTQQLSWFLTSDRFVVAPNERTLLIVLIPGLLFISTYCRLIGNCIYMYWTIRQLTLEQDFLDKKTKNSAPPPGHDASAAVAIPGIDCRGEQREARTGNSAPNGNLIANLILNNSENGSKKNISIFRTRPQSAICVRAGPVEKWVNHPKAVSREPLRIRTWNLEALTLTKHCMRQTRIYKKWRVCHSTRSRQDIGENSKLPTVQHEIRIGIVYPDQGENWRRLSQRPYENADI